jgi:hypothetical protein
MLNNWDLRLAELIEVVRLKPFSWGENDCLTFANKACFAQRGFGFADKELNGYKSATGALLKCQKWFRDNGYSDMVEAIDNRLTRIDTKYPPRGSIVAAPSNTDNVIPFSFGVSVNQYCAFVSYEGLVFIKPKSGFLYWSIE